MILPLYEMFCCERDRGLWKCPGLLLLEKGRGYLGDVPGICGKTPGKGAVGWFTVSVLTSCVTLGKLIPFSVP